jgi:transposase
MAGGTKRATAMPTGITAARWLSAESALRTWGLKLRERIGFKRAAIAVARKLAVIMHAMLKSGQPFDREAEAMS